MKVAERAERDREIVRRRLMRQPSVHIAEQMGVGERTVKRAWADYVKSGRLDPQDEDPVELVKDFIERFRALAAETAARLDEADNVAAFVGAIRTISDLMMREIELRQAVGFFPKDLGELRIQLDIQYVSRVVVEVLKRNKVPAKVREEIAAALDPASASQN